jgi:outer membrane protein assembly factor BamB
MHEPATALIAAGLLTLAWGTAPAWGLTISDSPASSHPGTAVSVGGTGFAANEAIDIYFDTTDEMLVFSDSSGNFSGRNFSVPLSALPGQHWISAVGRRNGDGGQKLFTVNTDWTTFGFGPAGKRNDLWENVLSKSSVGQLDLSWSRTMNGFGGIMSSPAIANGRAFIGSPGGTLYAFNSATGKPLWTATTTLGDAIVSSPAVYAGVVYVGSQDHKLYAFNAATGATKWTFTAGGPIDSSPVIANGSVYFGSEDEKLYALNATTGALVWSTTTFGKIYSSPAVANGAVYITETDGSFGYEWVVDAGTGTPVTYFNTGYPNLSSPVVAAGSIWIVAGSLNNPLQLLRYKLTDGNVFGTTPLGGNGGSDQVPNPAPAVANGIVYVAFPTGFPGAPAATIEAFKPTTGNALTVVWSKSLGPGGGGFGYGNSVPSSPAVANGMVFLGTGADQVFCALDAATGDLLWTGLAGSANGYQSNYSSPAVADGRMFVGGDDQLFAFALNAGDNAAYRNRQTTPPSFASLHPDFRLKPSR